MTRLLGAIGLAAAIALVPAGAAKADYVWDGPRLSAVTIYGTGTGTNTFATDGFFNDAPGDTFSYPVSGVTFAITGGYDWQAGRFVYGIETTVMTGNGGVSNYAIPSPYDPVDQDFELKFHWGATVNARVGAALDRTLFYVEAGPAFLHLITEANDVNDVNDGRVRIGRWPIGFNAGFGVEHAVTERMTFGVGYHYLVSTPTRIYSDSATPTDHTVQYRAHLFEAGVTWRYDQPEEARGRGLAGFDWAGAYVGEMMGSPASFHTAAGYNFVVGDRFVFGPEVRGAFYTCCQLVWGADALGRAGVIVDDNLLLFAEAGIRYRDELFALVGGGMEIAMSPRLSGMMALSALRRMDKGWGEIAFMGGIRFHLGPVTP